MQFEVIVIGASTSGLHAACKLAEAGKKVAVFDRQKELKPARRTLIVTPELRKVLPDIPSRAILHETGTIRLSSPGATSEVRLHNPDLIVERAAITRWLLSKAQDAGAEIFLGHRFVDVESGRGDPVARPNWTIGGSRSSCTNTAVRVHFHNHGPSTVLATEAIIGADGINSVVAREAGIRRPSSVPIVQAEVALPSGWDPDVTQVWFDTDDGRFFYWLIPESNKKGVVGLVGDDGTQTRELLANFLIQHDLEPEAFQGGKVSMHDPRRRPWGKIGAIPVLLVGDAAGQVKVTTVGGTVTGIQGAEAAVRSALSGRSYRRELRLMKRELDLHWFIRVLLERLGNQGYDFLVTLVASRLKDFLGCHNRDSMSPVFWRLPFVEPQLFRLVLHCLRSQSASDFRKSLQAKPTMNPEPEL